MITGAAGNFGSVCAQMAAAEGAKLVARVHHYDSVCPWIGLVYIYTNTYIYICAYIYMYSRAHPHAPTKGS